MTTSWALGFCLKVEGNRGFLMCFYSQLSGNHLPLCDLCGHESHIYVLLSAPVVYPEDFVPEGGLFHLWKCGHCGTKQVSFFPYYFLSYFTSPTCGFGALF